MTEFSRKYRAGYVPIDAYSQILDNSYNARQKEINNDLVVTIYGYERSTTRLMLFHGLSIILLAIPYLVFNWFPTLAYIKYKKTSLNHCDIVLVTTNHGHSEFTKIITIKSNTITLDYNNQINNKNRIFIYQHVRYIWSDVIEKFLYLGNPDDAKTLDEFLVDAIGVNSIQRDHLLQLYGENSIVINVKSYWNLFRSEILNPFYLFQFFSITLWSLDDYYYYAGCILLLSFVSIITSLYETRSQSITLKNLVESTKPDTVQIMLHGQPLDINPDDLVPGDILVLPQEGFILPCDAVLLTGTCIVNESMLTGESVPVMKTPPHHCHEKLSYESHKRNILFAGTTIVQTRCVPGDRPLARVSRTGYNTSKGELIKSILYPQPIGFKFYQDSIKFITGLFCIAILGMLYCVRVYMTRDEQLKVILIRTLDIITIVVPPALPMAMTAGTIYSQNRLKKLGIFCISPPRINVCGKIKLVCFDKTGTLTDDDLTLYGILEYNKTNFDTLTRNPSALNPYTEIVQAMATCHSLSIINGHVSGDPLDIEMFKSIDWDLIEPGDEFKEFMDHSNMPPTIVKPKMAGHNENYQINNLVNIESESINYLIGILKCYQFSSERQCMTVIARVLGHKNMKVFTKGSPEKIKQLCNSSTIPEDYFEKLHQYTKHGYRVLGLAYRELSPKIKGKDVNKMKREEVECRLNFLGFLILENCLKPETKSVIEDLHAANLRTVMITGDNIMTAISVARDCRMVLPDEDILILKAEHASDPSRAKITVTYDRNDRTEYSNTSIVNIQPWKYRSAMDGYTWTVLNLQFPEIIPQILARGTIFARFDPDQKAQLVMFFQQFDYIVAMCGDGANDCSALRAAHVGISLSQAEASAAAPFTSKQQNINCVKLLALEGRCALVTSFGLFKYMTMYSIIQFCTILILYSRCTLMGNGQFLYIDLGITASLAFTMGIQKPSSSLSIKRPMSSLISLANVIPLLFQIATATLIQLGALFLLMHQPWYHSEVVDSGNACSSSIMLKHKLLSSNNILSWDNTTVFLISCFQYLILGVIYCKGKPYRQPIYKNFLYVFFLTAFTVITTVMLVHPMKFLAALVDIKPYIEENQSINDFRLLLLVFPVIHLFIALFIEYFISERLWFKKVLHVLTRKRHPKNRYKIIENDLDNKYWLDIVQRNC